MHEFMLKAVAEAEKNIISKDGGPFGAVIVKDGVIVGTGHNEVLKNNDPTCHAEMQAIRDACRNLKTFDLTGCELYTSCYPCPMCLSATIWANIKRFITAILRRMPLISASAMILFISLLKAAAKMCRCWIWSSSSATKPL